MKRFLLAPVAALVFAWASPTAAAECVDLHGLSWARGYVHCNAPKTQKRRSVHHRQSHRRSARSYQRSDSDDHHRGGLVTVSTAAGIKITVASHLAHKFQGFIADLVSSGYRPRYIHCFARGGHVQNSRHYSGAACDIDQRGWGKTVGPMYRAGAMARRWGLRDGCSFRDCGHVDDGAPLRTSRRSRIATD